MGVPDFVQGTELKKRMQQLVLRVMRTRIEGGSSQDLTGASPNPGASEHEVVREEEKMRSITAH
jgi:hypothetical protein